MTSLQDFVARILAAPPDIGTAKNGTHAGLIKAMGLLVARSQRPPRRLAPLKIVGAVEHKLRTFAFQTPNRRARRGAPLPTGTKLSRRVPILYRELEDHSRYTVAVLRALRAEGAHR